MVRRSWCNVGAEGVKLHLFSWAAQLGAWDMVLIPTSSLQRIWTSCRWGYIIIWRPPTSYDRHNSHSIQPFNSQGRPLISLTGCTCYLYWCISSFDSMAGVNMLHKGVLHIPQSSSIAGTSPSDCLVSYPGHSLGGGLTSLQRSSQYILQPQPTGQDNFWDLHNITRVPCNLSIKNYCTHLPWKSCGSHI